MKKFIITAVAITLTTFSVLNLSGPAEALTLKALSDTNIEAGDLKASHKDGVALDMSMGEIATAIGAF